MGWPGPPAATDGTGQEVNGPSRMLRSDVRFPSPKRTSRGHDLPSSSPTPGADVHPGKSVPSRAVAPAPRTGRRNTRRHASRNGPAPASTPAAAPASTPAAAPTRTPTRPGNGDASHGAASRPTRTHPRAYDGGTTKAARSHGTARDVGAPHSRTSGATPCGGDRIRSQCQKQCNDPKTGKESLFHVAHLVIPSQFGLVVFTCTEACRHLRLPRFTRAKAELARTGKVARDRDHIFRHAQLQNLHPHHRSRSPDRAGLAARGEYDGCRFRERSGLCHRRRQSPESVSGSGGHFPQVTANKVRLNQICFARP